MKNYINPLFRQFCLFCLFANLATAQVNFVQISSNDTAYCSQVIENSTPGNFDVNTLGAAMGPTIYKKYKNTETPNWSTISSNSIPANDITINKSFKSFLYNGKPTIAYINSNGLSIVISQWDASTNQYTAILPLLTPTYLGNFDVCVNPITHEIYVSCEYPITTTSINVYHYDGSAWVLDLPQFNPFGISQSLNHPEIYFNDSTLYLAVVNPFIDSLLIYKQNYTNFNTANLIPVTASNPISVNISDYSMEGIPGQDPYFATYNNSTGAISLSNIQANVITFLGGTSLPPTTIAKLNLAFKNGNPEILTTSIAGGVGTSKILALNGSSLTSSLPDVANITGTTTINNVYLVSSANGLRNFASITSSIGGASSPRSVVYASNNKPSISNSSYEDTICHVTGADYNTRYIGEITFNDMDGDPVYITDIIASDQTVLEIGIFGYTIEKTQSIGGLTTYKITAINTQGPGVANLNIVYSDGYELDTLTFNAIHSLSSVSTPVALTNSTSNGVLYCDNSDVIDLKKSTDPYIGSFVLGEENISDGILSVEEYLTSANYPEFLYTDVSGCVTRFPLYGYSVTAPTASATTTPTDCAINNGSATLTYTASAAPINDIYWSAGFHDSLTLSNLYAGQYLVTVTDTNDCRASAVANIDLNGLTVSENIINAICAGNENGSIQLTVSGSDAPYTYLWSNGKSTSSIYNLAAGDYEVVITSASGCQMVKTYTVAQPFGPLVINDYPLYPPDCNVSNGQLDANPSGGLAPYTFQWSNGGNTQQINSLSAGIYHVKVSDVLGCSTEKDVKLDDYNTPSVSANQIVAPTCGLNNGYIDAKLSDMTLFSSVSWSNGATTMYNGNLSGGTYTCVAKTNEGCKAFGVWNLASSKPLQNNICMLTVDSATNTNLIVWEKVQTNIDHYNIYREGSVADQFELIDTVSGLNHSIFNDVVASPKTHSWRYKISAVNQCGVEGPLSVAHKTIHLVISQSIGTQYNIVWDKYEGFDYSTLNLWRYTNVNSWEMIAALPSNIFSYTDDLSTIDPTGIDYVVEIAPPTPCSPDKAQDYNSSRSNKANSIMVPGVGNGASNNSITEYGNALPISMYPNPTNGLINFINENNGKTNVIVYDQSGKELDHFTFEKETKKNYQYLNSGVYYIRFMQENSTTVKKLIIY